MPESSIRDAFRYEAVARDRSTMARAGLFRTPHGTVETPVFMPVGTRATVKAVSPDELAAVGARIILANTYHLHLQPGSNLIASFGGLHDFMSWNRPILTDSGGFQVFSLAERSRDSSGSVDSSLVARDDDGVTFRSYVDGSEHRFTPELAIEVQERLGADVIMAFDECSRTSSSHAEARTSMEITHRWAERCKRRWLELEVAKTDRPPQALFGIVQGGAHRDLRRASAELISGLDLPGIAIGGESIGYSKALTRDILEWIADLLPFDRPRYAMGVGEPADFFAIVERGIDMFDSVLPTRMARNGTLMTAHGRLRVINAEFATDPRPIEPDCDCATCASFSRGYIRHLFKSEALLAYRLATVHNLRFCLRLVERIRASIVDGSFTTFRDYFLSGYNAR